jgi:hypothetical protein
VRPTAGAPPRGSRASSRAQSHPASLASCVGTVLGKYAFRMRCTRQPSFASETATAFAALPHALRAAAAFGCRVHRMRNARYSPNTTHSLSHPRRPASHTGILQPYWYYPNTTRSWPSQLRKEKRMLWPQRSQHCRTRSVRLAGHHFHTITPCIISTITWYFVQCAIHLLPCITRTALQARIPSPCGSPASSPSTRPPSSSAAAPSTSSSTCGRRPRWAARTAACAADAGARAARQ